MDKQGPIASHRELHSLFCNNPQWKRIWKTILIHITESLCFTPETHTTLEINFNFFFKKCFPKQLPQSSRIRHMENRWTIPKLESNTANPYSETKTLKPACIHANHMSEKNKSLLSATECGDDLLWSISWLRHLKLSTLNCMLIFIICPLLWGDFCGFHGGSDGKESACKAGDPGLFPGSGRSSGEGNVYALQYSCLENSVDRSLAGYSVWGHKELDSTGWLKLSLSGERVHIPFGKFSKRPGTPKILSHRCTWKFSAFSMEPEALGLQQNESPLSLPAS